MPEPLHARQPDAASLSDARDALRTWFAEHGRTLPWRRRRDPYAVWVSEVMLQQTRAQAVTDYFERWMRRFPDLRALAAADEESVLRMWEGLGYYRRARNLHRAARRVVAADGALPGDEAGWRELPGVGPYTAAAVAALALGQRTVAVDGNVRRVGARLFALPAPTDQELRERLLPLLDPGAPGEGAEALIELGALLCAPREPACGGCPLRAHCAARRLDAVGSYPRPRRRPAAPRRRRYARVHRRGERVWLVRRPGDGLLAGLWGFPQQARRPTGTALPPLRHAYTHMRLELTPVLVEGPPADDDGRWFDEAEVGEAPLSVVDRRVLERLRAAERAGAGLLSSPT